MTMILSGKSRKRVRFGICSTEVTRKMAQNLRSVQHTLTPSPICWQVPPSLSTNNSLLLSWSLILPLLSIFYSTKRKPQPRPILVNTSKIIGGRFDTNIKPNLLTVAPLSVHQQQPPLLSTVDLTSPIYLLFDQEEASATPPILVNTSKIVGGRFEHLGGAPSVSQKVR